ncbi:MAG: ArsR family transcriptional regulator [Desulfobacter sp.]|nr:MAG: ArsR family transcriptional regulator [Desulfobacter sp.]
MSRERHQTIRQEIMVLLESEPMTIRDISQAAGIMEKEVIRHLESIEKSLKPKGKHLHWEPCVCVNCGFEFNSRKRFGKPGRCPECRESRIAPALYRIE